MTLWLSNRQGRMVCLERFEGTKVDDLEAGVAELPANRFVYDGRIGGDIRRSRFDHEDPGPTRTQELDVPQKNRTLVPLRDVLVQNVHRTDMRPVRFRLRGIAEDWHEIQPLLRQGQ